MSGAATSTWPQRRIIGTLRCRGRSYRPGLREPRKPSINDARGRILATMILFVLAVVAICLMLAWAVHMRKLEGRRPSGEVAKPAPLGAGFRASTSSKLTRLSDSGWRARSGEE